MMTDADADQRLLRRAGILRRRWRWILESAGVCAAAALLVSLTLPKIYRATSYILVSESKIGSASHDAPYQQVAMLPTYVPFVDNDALITQTLQKFQLDRPPYNLTAGRFRRRNYLDVQIPKSTRLLELSVEFPDARLAAGIVNDIAERAMAFNDRMTAADTLATQDFLRKQLAEANDRLHEAMERRLKAQQEAHIDDREKTLTILLSEKDHLSTRLEQLRVDVVQDESRSQSLQQSLAGEPQILKLTKSVTGDPYLQKAADKLNPQGPPLSMTEESLNVTHEEIQRSLVAAKANIASGQAGILAGTERLGKVNEEINVLLDQLARLRIEIDQADRDSVLANEAVKNAARLYQEASVTVNSKSQDMKQISPALVPERPVRPTILLNTMLGFLLGALAAAGFILVLENYRELRQPKSMTLDEIERVVVG
jgi:uncharacterized protein involved in exopolysaccharide biosynthesis